MLCDRRWLITLKRNWKHGPISTQIRITIGIGRGLRRKDNFTKALRKRWSFTIHLTDHCRPKTILNRLRRKNCCRELQSSNLSKDTTSTHQSHTNPCLNLIKYSESNLRHVTSLLRSIFRRRRTKAPSSAASTRTRKSLKISSWFSTSSLKIHSSPMPPKSDVNSKSTFSVILEFWN